jgi:RimJ/RimL family protein N-acetyltransferase
MTPPTLHTQRLTLRAPAMADFPAYSQFWASRRSRHMGGPRDTEGAWFWFCHDSAMWALLGHGALMVDRHDTGDTVGLVGINAGPLFPETELGWMLYPNHEGQGFATEAATALRAWAFDTLPVTSLVIYIDPANAASAALALRLGARLDPTATRREPADQVWRHHKGAAA